MSTYVNIPAVKAIAKSILEPADGQIHEAVAGGTTLLYAVRADLTVVTIGDIDAPFGRIDDDGDTEIEGFTFCAYSGWKDYINGAEAATFFENGSGYDDLVAGLVRVGGKGGKPKSVRGFAPYVTAIKEESDLVVYIDWSDSYQGLAVGDETIPVDEAEEHPLHAEWLDVDQRIRKLRKIRLNGLGVAIEVSDDE